jgi:hypothetical protein
MMALDAGCDGMPMSQDVYKELLVYTEVSCRNAGHAGLQLEPESWETESFAVAAAASAGRGRCR